MRLYRDKVKAPWKSFLSSGDKEYSQGKTTHDAADIRAMKSLAIVDEERRASAQVEKPSGTGYACFETDFEFFKYTHNLLREGNPAKVEAFLYKTLAPAFFVEGSTVLLNDRGERLVKAILIDIKNPKVSYTEQYAWIRK